MSYGARITVQFTAQNLTSDEDMAQSNMTFEQVVRWIIKEEGLMGIVDEEFKVVAIERTGVSTNGVDQ